jgi:UDP-glucose 4-epimerase
VARLVEEFRPEIVDHHAAHADVRQSVEDPASDARVNVVGTVSLLNAAVRAGVRKLIFASSGGAIYGDPDVVPCNEDHPARPVSPYAASKQAGEVYVQTFNRVHGHWPTSLTVPTAMIWPCGRTRSLRYRSPFRCWTGRTLPRSSMRPGGRC